MLFGGPALEIMIAVLNTAVACELLLGQATTQAGEGGDQLKRGSRRKPAHRTIDKRSGFVFLEHLPIFGFDAGDKGIWIERWHRSHCEDFARVWIDDDGSAATDRSQCFLSDGLDTGVDRQVNVRALLRRIFAQ